MNNCDVLIKMWEKQLSCAKNNVLLKKTNEKMTLLILFLLLPVYVSAGIIGNINLKLDASTPSSNVTIENSSYNVYLDYDVKLGTETMWREAFCVENANAVDGSTNVYTLLTVDSGLSSFGLIAEKYLKGCCGSSILLE